MVHMHQPILRKWSTQYTALAVAEGAGRNGHVKSGGDAEASLALKLSTPKSLGGKGDGQNPEQLFAMGYACTCVSSK